MTKVVIILVTSIQTRVPNRLRSRSRFRSRSTQIGPPTVALGAKKSISLLDMGIFSKKICTLLLVEIIISKVINDKSFPLNRKEQIKTRGN